MEFLRSAISLGILLISTLVGASAVVADTGSENEGEGRRTVSLFSDFEVTQGPGQDDIGPGVVQDEPVTLSRLLQIAESNNPELKALHEEVSALEGMKIQAGLYPNPELGFDWEDVPIQGPDLSESAIKLTYSQQYLLNDSMDIAVQIVEMEIQALELFILQKKRELSAEVSTVYLEILHIKQVAALYDEIISSAYESHNIARLRFDAGAVPESDVLNVEIYIAELELEKRRLEQLLTAKLDRLELFLGGVEIDPDTFKGNLLEEFVPASLDDLTAATLLSHPEITGSEISAEVATLQILLEEEEREQPIDLSFGITHDYSSHDNRIEFGISIPLTIFDRNEGNIIESEHRYSAALHQVVQVEAGIITDLEVAHAEFVMASDRISTIRDLMLPITQESLRQAGIGYQAGRVSFTSYLDSSRTHANTRLDLLESIRDFNLAIIEMQRIAGSEVIKFRSTEESEHE